MYNSINITYEDDKIFLVLDDILIVVNPHGQYESDYGAYSQKAKHVFTFKNVEDLSNFEGIYDEKTKECLHPFQINQNISMLIEYICEDLESIRVPYIHPI